MGGAGCLCRSCRARFICCILTSGFQSPLRVLFHPGLYSTGPAGLVHIVQEPDSHEKDLLF